MTGSPQPEFVVVEADLKRGLKFYVFYGPEPVPSWDRPCGGPYASEAEAQAEVDRRYEELAAEYEWVEEQARLGGYTVCW